MNIDAVQFVSQLLQHLIGFLVKKKKKKMNCLKCLHASNATKIWTIQMGTGTSEIHIQLPNFKEKRRKMNTSSKHNLTKGKNILK